MSRSQELFTDEEFQEYSQSFSAPSQLGNMPDPDFIQGSQPQNEDDENDDTLATPPPPPNKRRRSGEIIRPSASAPQYATPAKAGPVDNFTTISRKWYIEEGEKCM